MYYDVDILNTARNCNTGEIIHIATNGGDITYTSTDKLKLRPLDVRYNTQLIANVLSMKDTAYILSARLIMDTSEEKAIIVSLADGISLKFKECSDSLYYFNTKGSNNNNASVNHYLSFSSSFNFLNTVENPKVKFNKREINRVETVRK